jgi:hypothetical protein
MSAHIATDVKDAELKPQTYHPATSSPVPPTAATKYRSWGGELFNPRYENPQFNLTDIIPVVVADIKPSLAPTITREDNKHQSSGVGKFFKHKKTHSTENGATFKTVFMPRSEYLKYFATDDDGMYVGSESRRSWTVEELEKKFGEFRPKKNDRKDAGFVDRLFTSNARGL